ncbi:aldo/keto reductase [Paenibacillus hunanensis]|uniref:Diketogulonate reductase-like aldo/keto reductase n=1 Tax=Paenibacillus hunanensis TaxID=539262 RepID=A0ABU1ISM4_9BACL|nr:aldo/keto reductase [Paenibacillus hunanensis]MCL9659714.1 aldo/keto reductase [Paenibacillus hunanensis]MDR6242252.1 diketogulonate reductase-like aldo/keto reductase [Paenibacillus hunanensis]GGJ06429.1 glyoxal reductase [Paenibacillus hunanensis]
MLHLQSTTKLSNGVEMPWFGLGVYKVEEGDQVVNSVKWAIEAGYRSIDTAALYQNEEGVGQAIKESGVPREELFITTKVWNSDQGYDATLQAFEKSLSKLGLDYVDLYLVHWPVKGKYKDTWRALEKLHEDGKVRAIGVSNFQIHHLEDLLADAKVRPVVNQVELHPLLSQVELRNYCKEQGIQIEAWAPLAQGRLLDNPILQAIADKHGKSIAQVLLRWDIQSGIVTIPKSIKKERIVQNADIYDFELSVEEMKQIDDLNEDRRFGADPDNFDF